MKPKTENFPSLTQRCVHHDTNGRQCRTLALDSRSGLCPHHLALQQQNEASNVYAGLIRNSQGLQTAQGINYSLSNLYELLAKNRISPRRASVLAYINSLLLRTLPAIDADNAAGIYDPTKPAPVVMPIIVPAPTQVAEEGDDACGRDDADYDDHQDSDDLAAASSNPDANSKAVTRTPSNSPSDPGSTTAWDPSIPEPDPTKKPS